LCLINIAKSELSHIIQLIISPLLTSHRYSNEMVHSRIGSLGSLCDDPIMDDVAHSRIGSLETQGIDY
jgi:hypothetical protein